MASASTRQPKERVARVEPGRPKAFRIAVAIVAVAAAVTVSSSPGRASTSLRSASAGANCGNTSVGLTPLIDLTGSYHGFRGGLYQNGSNVPPPTYLSVGNAAAAKVTPVSPAGVPTQSHGRIVLLSIGMSNASDEFTVFQQLTATDSSINPEVATVNGAQPGQDAEKIKDPSAPYWSVVDSRLASASLSPRQVEAVWLKEAIMFENEQFPADSTRLQSDLDAIVSILTQRFPNLHLIYLSSRTYAGYASTDLNPEPIAYESGFSVKWLIQDQIAAKSSAGPWLGWGPYLWTDGLAGRSDGLVWTCSDVTADGTHPSQSGSSKVANLLLGFFKTDSTARGWFLR